MKLYKKKKSLIFIMEEINTNLYSRQIYTYGMDTMKKIINLKILVIGLRGLGIEICKNLILAGPKELAIYDKTICKISDLGSNFYISESDINKNPRDFACYKKLSELNPYVKIKIYESKNIIDKINDYNFVIITELMKTKELYIINDICRKNHIGFIYTCSLGLTGFLFNDFGDKHCIYNENGKDNLVYNLSNIIQNNDKYEIYIDLPVEQSFDLNDGSYVIFKNIKGLEELNSEKPKKITKLSNNLFTIENNNLKNNGTYISGGIIEEYKIPKEIKFLSLKNNFDIPIIDKNTIILDSSKLFTNELLHCAIVGLHKYFDKRGKLPELNNLKQVEEVINFCHNYYNNAIKKDEDWIKIKNKKFLKKNPGIKYIKFDKSYITKVIQWSFSEINPICCFLGGIAAQEVIKITGKYTPIYQWLRFDFFETVENLPNKINRHLLNSRYDDQIAIFGQELQEKLSKLNIFMIGAGALGCEYLKNFALMGISTNSNSCVSVTDNDNIVLSNLNRQFLFRNNDIGLSKSFCACREAKKINRKFNTKEFQNLLNDETKDIFNDIFWENQNIIVSAVDNRSARKYIDNQCTFYTKLFIDAGTQGTQANSDIYSPNKTKCLNDLFFPPKKEIASCTLKFFPTQIEHCIEWAKQVFTELFEQHIKELKMYVEDENNFFNLLKEGNDEKELYLKLKNLKYIIKILLEPSKELIISYAMFVFYQYFDYNIELVFEKFPVDSMNEDGVPFWNKFKKMPHPLNINETDFTTLNFFNSFYYIFSKIVNFKELNEIKENEIKEIIKKNNLNYMKIKNKKSNLINDSIKQENYNSQSNNDLIEKFKNKTSINFCNLKNKINNLTPEIFEKDNDENNHVNFILSISNLRANNYGIDNCNFLKAKEIAGNIIPAIASTTAAITGLACLQIYTLLQTDNISYIRSTAFNLATSQYDFFIPEEVQFIESSEKTENNSAFIVKPCDFTVWDMLYYLGPNLTVKDIVEDFKYKYDADIDYINCGELLLTSPFDEEGELDFDKTIEDLYKERTEKGIIDKNMKYLKLNISASSGSDEIKTPFIKYLLKK